MRRSTLASIAMLASAAAAAQDAPPSAPVQFEVVSIKRNTSVSAGGGIRSLPDGTMIMTNQPIRSIMSGASPVPAREIEGLPDWVTRDRYDVTTRPPAGSTREQRAEMIRAMFADRMKLQAHVEQRERDTFALVVARSDGKLGPQLKPSTLDCGPRPPGTPPPEPPASFSTDDAAARCGGLFGRGLIVSGGIALDSLAFSLAGLAGRLVDNRTGLQGFYALKLQFVEPGAPGAASLDDNLPDFFTALQEQLGLKLQPEKTIVPIFVVDHIERPTEN